MTGPTPSSGCAIQWGTSLAYPLSSMAAHVSAVPNHQVGRVTPLSTRAAVAFFGVFGYELDPTALTADERAEIADQIALYVRYRDVFQRGRFVRLESPFEADHDEVAWMAVSEDRRRAVVGYYRILGQPVPGPCRLRLRGLDPRRHTRSRPGRPTGSPSSASPGERGGAELMAAGFSLDLGRNETDVPRRLLGPPLHARGPLTARTTGSSAGSALGRAQGQAAHELLREHQVHDDRGQGDEERRRGQQVVVREERALEVVERGRDRPSVARLHQEQRPEEVVVDERELERREGREGRPAERQDHLAGRSSRREAPSTSAASVSSLEIVFM